MTCHFLFALCTAVYSFLHVTVFPFSLTHQDAALSFITVFVSLVTYYLFQHGK